MLDGCSKDIEEHELNKILMPKEDVMESLGSVKKLSNPLSNYFIGAEDKNHNNSNFDQLEEY